MNWILFAARISLLLLSTAIDQASGIRCYVCGDPSDLPGVRPEQSDTSLLSCEEFDRSQGDSLKKFIVDCPNHYKGCITQKQGNNVYRACDTVAFDDCQSANGITYCYCSGNLCNAPGAMKLSTTSAAYIDLNKVEPLTDDEDYVDASGDDDIINFDSNERRIIIKGTFETEKTKSIETNEDGSQPSTHANEYDDGNDFITTGDESVQLVGSGPTSDSTKPDTTSTWSTIPSNLSTNVKESKSTTITSATTSTTTTSISSTHAGDVKKSSTRITGSNGSCKVFSSQMTTLLVLIVVTLLSY